MLGDLAGKLIADKYRVGALLREGESGDLYTGSSEIQERPVTLKILPTALAVDERWVKRFVREARSASLLSHPGILNITDFGTDSKGISYAVYEPTDGETLDRALTEEPMDERAAIDIARQIAAAVSAAHEKKTVHGNLSPQNVFVGEENSVKVYGFGGDPLNVSRNADPRYLAPEQCNAFPASDERSDVYSLGVMLYQLLAGTVPYEGATAADILKKQNSEPPPPISAFRRDLHPEIEPIVLSAMAVDPERRYQTMSAFAEDLDILAGRLGSPVAEKAVAANAGTTPRRNVWQTAIFVFVGIAIFAGALIYATSVRQTDPTETVQADAGSLPVQPIGPATGAQEESLAKLPALTDAEILATQNQMMSDLPGGDGFNAWANGGIPPAGAPLTSGPLAGSMPGTASGIPTAPPAGYVPPGGQMYTVGEGQSQFMPDFSPTGTVELRCRDVQTGQDIPCPTNAPQPGAKPSPTPKTPAANTAVPQPAPEGAPTPKPMATPPPKNTKPTDQPDKAKPNAKPSKSGTPKDSEELLPG